MQIAVADFEITQGADWDQVLIWEEPEGSPVDLSAASATMHIRTTPPSPTVLLELSTVNGKIVLNEQPGSVRLIASEVDTAALPVMSLQKRGYYDLRITVGTQTLYLVEGRITVRQRVTR